MPTFQAPIHNNRVLLTVQVTADGEPPKNNDTWRALLDTGAQCTLVSPRVVSRLQVPSTSVGAFTPANGEPVETDIYRLSISVPVRLGPLDDPSAATFSSGSTVDVMLLPFIPDAYDVILGMDLMAQYHITLHGSLFLCSI